MKKEIFPIDIVFENEDFAVLNKERGLPTAPLKAGDESLLTYFLKMRELKEHVVGRKAVEEGLLHRLDTATSGLVLIAKTQKMYDVLQHMQEMHLITKEYLAFCDYVPSLFSRSIVRTEHRSYSFTIESGFAPFGKRGHKVKICNELTGSERVKNQKMYTTQVSIEKTNCLKRIKAMLLGRAYNKEISHQRGEAICRCSITQGYRHQVRCHLSSIGLPIKCDALYNAKYIAEHSLKRIELEKANNSYQLELYAVKLAFPSPYVKDEILSFSIPQPNKTNP